MGGYRPARIAELILKEVSQRMSRDIQDFRLSPISITNVDVSRDLGRAVIKYLPLGGEPVSDEMRQALKDTAIRLRGPVGRALGIRHSPELVFVFDEHTEAAIRVTGLLERIGRELKSDEPTAEGEE